MTQPEFDLVSASEIAAMAGTARSTVSNWKRRHSDFPPERGTNPRGPLYDRAEVATWLAHRTANPGAAATEAAATTRWEKRLWSLANEMRGVWSNEDFALAVARTLVNLPLPRPLVESAGDSRASTFTTQLLEVAGDTLERREDAIDAVLSRPLRSDLGASVTPRCLSTFMAQLLGPRSSILDPACGVGQDLVACAGQTSRICGQEVKADLAEIARGRLWNVVIGPENETSVATGDSLREDLFPEPFDGVICTPPFGHRLGTDALSPADSRWSYEYPGTSGDAAWIQHVVAHLAPGGRGVIALAPNIAFASGVIDRLRTSLIRSGVLRAVIGLPSKTFNDTAIEPILMVLERPLEPTPSPTVLIASPFEASAWSKDEGFSAASTISRWLDGGELQATDHYTAVGLEELASEGFDLTPQRHLRPVHEEPRPLGEVRKEALNQVQFAEIIATAASTALKDISDPLPTVVTPTPRVPLGELVTINRGVPNQKLAKDGSIGVYTPRTLFSDDPPDRFLPAEADPLVGPRFGGSAEPGDILVAVDGLIGRTALIDGPMFVSSMFAILRPREGGATEVDARYLASWLRTPQCQTELARLTRGLTMQRLSVADLRSVLVPVPPMDLQLALAKIDETLEDCAGIASSLAESTERARELYREAMAAGLPPDPGGRS